MRLHHPVSRIDPRSDTTSTFLPVLSSASRSSAPYLPHRSTTPSCALFSLPKWNTYLEERLTQTASGRGKICFLTIPMVSAGHSTKLTSGVLYALVGPKRLFEAAMFKPLPYGFMCVLDKSTRLQSDRQRRYRRPHHHLAVMQDVQEDSIRSIVRLVPSPQSAHSADHPATPLSSSLVRPNFTATYQQDHSP